MLQQLTVTAETALITWRERNVVRDVNFAEVRRVLTRQMWAQRPYLS